jgi:hypothetical protein
MTKPCNSKPPEQLDMTLQQQILDIAARMGANPKEVELAVALVRTGDAILIVQVMAAKLTIKAALAKGTA